MIVVVVGDFLDRYVRQTRHTCLSRQTTPRFPISAFPRYRLDGFWASVGIEENFIEQTPLDPREGGNTGHVDQELTVTLTLHSAELEPNTYHDARARAQFFIVSKS